MDKKLKQILKVALPGFCVVPLLASSMALFLVFDTKESAKTNAIISLELTGNNGLDISFSYANLIKYLDGENVPLSAAQKFQNLAHYGTGDLPIDTQSRANYLQNAYQLLVNNDDFTSSSNNIMKPFLDNQNLSPNSGFLNKLGNLNLQGLASFDIFAVPIDAVNPPPDGEQLASFSLSPQGHFANPDQKFFQQSGKGGVLLPSPSANPTDFMANFDNIYSQFKTETQHKTIVGGSKYSLEFQLNAVSNKAKEAPATDRNSAESQTGGWMSDSVGAEYFRPYFADNVWAPDLSVGSVFQFPVYIDPKLENENIINNASVVKFDIGASFGISNISIVNIIWIIGAAIITLSLFSPLIIYAIRKW